jgi:hypothetical protein
VDRWCLSFSTAEPTTATRNDNGPGAVKDSDPLVLLYLVPCHTTFALSGSAWETRQCGYRHLSQSLNSGVAPVAVGRVGEPCNEIGGIMSEIAAYGTAVTVEPLPPNQSLDGLLTS